MNGANPPLKAAALRRYAESSMPTTAGPLKVVVYRVLDGVERPVGEEKEHLAIVAGDIGGDDVLARVHSECWTGETLGSLKCDCRAQLDEAITAITQTGRGVIVYLRQEGRGIGLGNKIRAYALQAEGADTVEANEKLGFAADLRSYDIAAAILGDLGVRSVALMTNNADKVRGLEEAGVRVVRRVPHWHAEQEHNQGYLEVKRSKLGHLE